MEVLLTLSWIYGWPHPLLCMFVFSKIPFIVFLKVRKERETVTCFFFFSRESSLKNPVHMEFELFD